jgi:hypothetical protein
MSKIFIGSLLLVLATTAHAHTAAWVKGMYCINGTHVNPPGGYDDNETPVNPLYQLNKTDWWFHHVDKCDEEPPDPGDIVELPAGGSFTVELAHNRGQTNLSFGGRFTSEWPE